MSVALAAVYTRPWTVELILDLTGYKANTDLVGKIAVEPSDGDGAFLVPMVERLVASCRRQKRSITDCVSSLVAYKLDARLNFEKRIFTPLPTANSSYLT